MLRDILIWLHFKRSSSHIAANLRATWTLQFWHTWPGAANLTLLLDERSYLQR